MARVGLGEVVRVGASEGTFFDAAFLGGFGSVATESMSIAEGLAFKDGDVAAALSVRDGADVCNGARFTRVFVGAKVCCAGGSIMLDMAGEVLGLRIGLGGVCRCGSLGDSLGVGSTRREIVMDRMGSYMAEAREGGREAGALTSLL